MITSLPDTLYCFIFRFLLSTLENVPGMALLFQTFYTLTPLQCEVLDERLLVAVSLLHTASTQPDQKIVENWRHHRFDDGALLSLRMCYAMLCYAMHRSGCGRGGGTQQDLVHRTDFFPVALSLSSLFRQENTVPVHYPSDY